jgi:hypothetical protein
MPCLAELATFPALFSSLRRNFFESYRNSELQNALKKNKRCAVAGNEYVSLLFSTFEHVMLHLAVVQYT